MLLISMTGMPLISLGGEMSVITDEVSSQSDHTTYDFKASRMMIGWDGSSHAHPILTDLNGHLYTMLRTMSDGAVVYLYASPEGGLLMSGYDGSLRRSLKSDIAGRLNTLLVGMDGATARNIACDANGKLKFTTV